MTRKKISRALGLWSLGESEGFHKRKDPRILKDIVKAAYRCGTRKFDSAFSYKEADSMFHSAMKELGITEDGYSVIYKIMPLETLERKAETGLRRLGISRYDTLLLHWPTENDLFKSLKTLERLKERGLANRIGTSNFPSVLTNRIRNDFELSCNERAYCPVFQKDIENETLPSIFYGIYGFGCLLRDDIPDDRRKELYFYAPDALESFLALRKALKDASSSLHIGEKDCLLAFAERQEPETIILGASNTGQAEALMDEAEDPGDEVVDGLRRLGLEVEKHCSGDNIFSHRWRQSVTGRTEQHPQSREISGCGQAYGKCIEASPAP